MNAQTLQHRHPVQSPSKRLILAGLLGLPALALSGCYVVPVAPDGTPYYPGPVAVAVAPPPGTAPPAPAVLNVRLYPANDLATPGGILVGTVTNLMGGRGRFQFNYQGETLVGEATRVSGDERRGIASAYGQKGTHASCEYQMSTTTQGAGHCTFSNGAKYNVHIGG